MKNLLKNQSLPGLALILGLAGRLALSRLYLRGVDEKGLLIPWDPFAVVLLVLTAAAAALTLWSFRLPAESPAKPDKAAAVGAFLLAAGIAASLPGQEYFMLLDQTCLAVGVASAAGMVWAGICCLRGKEPFFLCFGAVCLYLLLRLVCCYRPWSGDPQLMNYLYSAAGLMLLAMTAYYQAAAAVGLGNPRALRGSALAAAFLCLTAAAQGEFPLLFTAGGIWAAFSARWDEAEV